MKRTFTGHHMLALCCAFFGVVIAVNMVMAVQASRTFGGTVVDNSYVASQHFNRWLKEARTEKQRGWRAQADRRDGHVSLTLWDLTGALDGADVTAVAEHPLGRQADIPLHFRFVGKGYYRSIEPLPTGRWRLKLDIDNATTHGRLIAEVAA